MATKPTDFVEKYSNEFGANTPDVANVPQNADPKSLLFGKNPPPVEAEPESDFWKWDGDKQEFFVEVENGGRLERFSGKTRTEAARNLAEGKKNLNAALANERNAAKTLTPDTKLPFDPIQRGQSRTLTAAEVYQISEIAQSDPLRAQEMLFQARTGYTMEQVAASVEMTNSMRQQIYAAEVAGSFVGDHQKDFEASPANMALVEGWLKDRKLPVTRNNLEIAFSDLRGTGKLTSPAQNVPRGTIQTETPLVQEFTPPPPPVSPPTRPAPVVASGPGVQASREEVAAIQSGSLSDARSAIQTVFRRASGGAR